MWGSPRAQRRSRILCAVSNEETRWLLETPLTLSGYLVRTTAKSSEALSLARCGLFDLYVVDISLCAAENVDLCRGIRSFDGRTPIVLCTTDPVLGGAPRAESVLDPRIPERVEKVVAALLQRARGNDGESRLAERRAILEEIEDRSLEFKRQVHAAAALRLRSAGYMAYVQKGGTRAGFARLWPDTFEESLVEAPVPRR
jgi:DNA-binding response OmpR family regulator